MTNRFPLATAILALAAPFALGQPAAAASKKDEPAAAGPKFNLSKPVQNAVADAQKAMDAKDYATANTKLDEATAAAKTDDDTFIIQRLRVEVTQGSGDKAAEIKALAAVVDNPKLSPDLHRSYLTVMANLAGQSNDTASERQAIQKLIALDPNDPNSYLLLGDLENDAKNYPAAMTDTEKAVDLLKAQNKPVDPALYHNLFAFAYNAHNTAGIAKYGPMMVAADPTPHNWQLVISNVRNASNWDDQAQLDLYRLMDSTNALDRGADYVDYADLASRRGLPGEAVRVLDTAKAKNVAVNASDAATIRSSASGKIAADKASLAGSEAAARAAATGRPAGGLADAYLNYGEYAKAADLYRVALQKGGAGVDAATYNTRLGIALARSGQKAEAKAAFAAVTGPRQQIAALWNAWLDRQG